jgi:hypothetical protein
MMRQLLLRVPPALSDGPQLTRRQRTCETIMVVTMLLRARALILAHTGIVPLEIHNRKEKFGIGQVPLKGGCLVALRHRSSSSSSMEI